VDLTAWLVVDDWMGEVARREEETCVPVPIVKLQRPMMLSLLPYATLPRPSQILSS